MSGRSALCSYVCAQMIIEDSDARRRAADMGKPVACLDMHVLRASLLPYWSMYACPACSVDHTP